MASSPKVVLSWRAVVSAIYVPGLSAEYDPVYVPGSSGSGFSSTVSEPPSGREIVVVTAAPETGNT